MATTTRTATAIRKSARLQMASSELQEHLGVHGRHLQ